MSERVKLTARIPVAKKKNLLAEVQKTDFSQSMNSPVDHILFLHRSLGNQAMEKLFKSGMIQAELKIGRPGDIYEQEADRVTEQVMCMPESHSSNGKGKKANGSCDQNQIMPVSESSCPECKDNEEELVQPKPIAGQITPLVQTQIDEEERQEEESLQAKEFVGQTPEVTPEIESRIQSIRGDGQPLDPATRAYFEPRFGYDFSHVRVHTDAKAIEAARSLNAKAFTAGSDIVVGMEQYSPWTVAGGRWLLGHELTHVVQQKQDSNKNSKTNPTFQINLMQFVQEKLSNQNSLQLKEIGEKWISSSIVIRKGILPLITGIFDAKDASHIRKSKDNKLGIDSDYKTPLDSFRWNILKEIINSKEKVEIKISNSVKVTFNFAKEGKVVSTNVDDVIRGVGFTAVSKNLHKRIYGKLDNSVTSQHDDISMIYISTLGDSNTMAHELFGHFYLATKGVPFGHEDVLTETHNIKDPTGKVFTGKVIDFVKKFVEKPTTLELTPPP